MKEHVVLRVPAEWEGWLNSAHVEGFLRDYFVRRQPLPDDPGSDAGGRVSLSLPRKPLRVFCALLDQRPSVALRRLIAGYAGELPEAGVINVFAAARESATGHEIVPVRPAHLARVERAPKVTPWIVPGSCPTQYFGTYREFNEWENRVLEARERGLPMPSPSRILSNRWTWFILAVLAAAAVVAVLWSSRSSVSAPVTGGAGLAPWTPEVLNAD